MENLQGKSGQLDKALETIGINPGDVEKTADTMNSSGVPLDTEHAVKVARGLIEIIYASTKDIGYHVDALSSPMINDILVSINDNAERLRELEVEALRPMVGKIVDTIKTIMDSKMTFEEYIDFMKNIEAKRESSDKTQLIIETDHKIDVGGWESPVAVVTFTDPKSGDIFTIQMKERAIAAIGEVYYFSAQHKSSKGSTIELTGDELSELGILGEGRIVDIKPLLMPLIWEAEKEKRRTKASKPFFRRRN